MAIFKLLQGGHLAEDGVYYQKNREGPVVYVNSNRDLIEECPGKFERVTSPDNEFSNPAESQIHLAETHRNPEAAANKPAVNLAEMVANDPLRAERAMQFDTETAVNPIQPPPDRVEAPVIQPPQAAQPPKTLEAPTEESMGDDKTEDFPKAVKKDLVVFRKKGRFYIFTEEDRSVVGAAGGYLGKAQVDAAIAKYKG